MNDIRYSRPVAAAERVSANITDSHRFSDKRVLITGVESVLSTTNGKDCLLASLRLLIRISRNVSVSLPKGLSELISECHHIVDPLTFGAPIDYLPFQVKPDGFDAILSIGAESHKDLPWTVINSNGWLARVSSGQKNLSLDCDQTNPIGSLVAACLGVTEVFKRLIPVKTSRGPLVDGLTFNLMSYRCDDQDPGPAIPPRLTVDLLLAGVGAIGNGVVYLLERLPFAGRLLLVDLQDFAPENLGTCVLIGPQDIGKSKALFGAELLRTRMDTFGFKEDLSTFADRLGIDVGFPQVVLGSLDNIIARHQIQGFWPDLIIDGAIGDFACQVSRHPWAQDIACMRCLYPALPSESADLVASRATGLSLNRVREATEVVNEKDVEIAPIEQQQSLRSQIGHPICSVIQAAILQRVSNRHQDAVFAPSVPFVACFSASMVVGELVKYTAGWSSPLGPRFQFDALTGPAYGELFPEKRRSSCYCVERQANIDKIRKRRGR